ncbi:YitT family protein [Paenibacillus albiflavus]|uniref:YitT family protein n=1 Tax=Paenibacillus albiflavus TaxID=2545760 RepID=A0A4R4E5H0_9BACL|nr:YitT family protein [Paenibacillus albiflavus]TCZ74267.1 YitT family protein [Paenibacillus albiflavus]
MRKLSDLLLILIGNIIITIGFNWFLIPHKLLSGGVSGVAMLVGYFTDWSIPLLYFLFNLPIIIWGLIVIGRRFIMISVVSVILTTWFMGLIPAEEIVHNSILAAVSGGVLVGLGAGILLRIGGSSGGFDIVGLILTRRYDFPLGTVLTVLNAIVIIILGYKNDNWDLALNSMLAIYLASLVIDTVHIRHIKVTAFIVTSKKQEMLTCLLRLPRGVTVMKAEGAYSQGSQDVLMTVTTKYELAELKRLVTGVDANAFVNIVETVGIWGKFNRLD